MKRTEKKLYLNQIVKETANLTTPNGVMNTAEIN